MIQKNVFSDSISQTTVGSFQEPISSSLVSYRKPDQLPIILFSFISAWAHIKLTGSESTRKKKKTLFYINTSQHKHNQKKILKTSLVESDLNVKQTMIRRLFLPSPNTMHAGRRGKFT